VIRRESAEPKPVQAEIQPVERGNRYLVPWLLLFAGSGCAALIYEIVWFQFIATGDRLLGRIAGIASGCLHGRTVSGQRRSAVAGFKRHHPMRVYALLELGVRGVRDHRAVWRPLDSRAFTSTGAGQTGWWD